VIGLFATASAATLGGVVLDEDGATAVSGATVTVYDLRLGYAAATSTNDGGWSISGLPGGAYRVRVSPSDGHAQRYWPDATAYCDAEAVRLDDDDEVLDLELRVRSGAAVRGRVVDMDGWPLAGVDVEAEGLDTRVEGLSYEAATDEDGRFTLVGLDADDAGAPTSYWLRFSGEGLPDQFAGPSYDDDEAQLLTVALGGEHDVGELTVLAGAVVEGSVEGPDGPLADVDVHVYSSSQVVTVVSDEDGTFRAAGVPPGEVLAWGSRDGLAMTYHPDADRPDLAERFVVEEGEVETIAFAIQEGGRIDGHVLDDAGQDLSGVTLLVYNDDHTVGIGGQCDAEGSFSIDRLHPGDHHLFVYGEAEGFLNELVGGDVDPEVFTVPDYGEALEVELDLPLGARLVGTVVDDLGEPVYGAYVYATRAGDAGGSEAALTDREGGYVLDGLAEGAWALEVFYAHYCDSDPGYVRVYHPGQVSDALQVDIGVDEGELWEDMDFVLPIDDDHDEMGDIWEGDWGLDVGRDDGAEDPDGDGYTNLEEYRLGTDPTSGPDGAGGCGCAGCSGGSAAVLMLPLGLWRRRA